MSRPHAGFEKMKAERPLLAARAAVDVAYRRRRSEVRRRIDQGAKPLKLYDETFEDPETDAAKELLRAAPALDGHRWTEWFQLGVSADTIKQRAFAPYAFTKKEKLAELRKRIHTDAYGILGGFIRQAVDLQKIYNHGLDYDHLKGTIGELVSLALLNRCRPAIAGAGIASADADMLSRVDAVYRYYPDRGTEPKKLDLQIKTTADTELLRFGVLQIGLQKVMGGPEDEFRAATLITRELDGGLSSQDAYELAMRAGMLQGKVHEAAKVLVAQTVNCTEQMRRV